MYFENELELYIEMEGEVHKIRALPGTEISIGSSSKSFDSTTLSKSIGFSKQLVEELKEVSLSINLSSKSVDITISDILLWNSLVGRINQLFVVEPGVEGNKLQPITIYIKTGSLIYRINDAVAKSVSLSTKLNDINLASWSIVGKSIDKVSYLPPLTVDTSHFPAFMLGKKTFVNINGIEVPITSLNISCSNTLNTVSRKTIGSVSNLSDIYTTSKLFSFSISCYLRDSTVKDKLLYELSNERVELEIDMSGAIFILPSAKVTFTDLDTSSVVQISVEGIAEERLPGSNDEFILVIIKTFEDLAGKAQYLIDYMADTFKDGVQCEDIEEVIVNFTPTNIQAGSLFVETFVGGEFKNTRLLLGPNT